MSEETEDSKTTRNRGEKGFQVNPKEPVRAFVLVPLLKSAEQQARREGFSTRSPESRLEEAVGLAAAISLNVVGSAVVPLAKPRPATLLGEGKVDELKGQLAELRVELVVVDGPLGPGQQRNLERAWKVKVLDRTGLILEIFGERARTREGTLQVELAHLNYQKSRLVRSWTHLERQRGGFGFLGGPGETQIEADRRMIQERITKIERQLETVKRTRQLHRKTRRDAPYPVVALVGYTNAGKSTLFNRLTEAGVFAENLLFATLDPTMRGLMLPSGRKIILSDTVGFISDLPTELVAAFRATLEEVLAADIILHVRDISHPNTTEQAADVDAIMKSLGVDEEVPLLEVWNKVDLLDGESRDAILTRAAREEDVFAVSALTGEGLQEMLAEVTERLQGETVEEELRLAFDDGRRRSWLFNKGLVQHEHQDEDGFVVKVRWTAKDRAQFETL